MISGGSFEWYLGRADKLLAELFERNGPVAVIGHSAGGWLARLLLGDVPYQGAHAGRGVAGWSGGALPCCSQAGSPR